MTDFAWGYLAGTLVLLFQIVGPLAENNLELRKIIRKLNFKLGKEDKL
jgi:hypothetical protein